MMAEQWPMAQPMSPEEAHLLASLTECHQALRQGNALTRTLITEMCTLTAQKRKRNIEMLNENKHLIDCLRKLVDPNDTGAIPGSAPKRPKEMNAQNDTEVFLRNSMVHLPWAWTLDSKDAPISSTPRNVQFVADLVQKLFEKQYLKEVPIAHNGRGVAPPRHVSGPPSSSCDSVSPFGSNATTHSAQSATPAGQHGPPELDVVEVQGLGLVQRSTIMSLACVFSEHGISDQESEEMLDLLLCILPDNEEAISSLFLACRQLSIPECTKEISLNRSNLYSKSRPPAGRLSQPPTRLAVPAGIRPVGPVAPGALPVGLVPSGAGSITSDSLPSLSGSVAGSDNSRPSPQRQVTSKRQEAKTAPAQKGKQIQTATAALPVGLVLLGMNAMCKVPPPLSSPVVPQTTVRTTTATTAVQSEHEVMSTDGHKALEEHVTTVVVRKIPVQCSQAELLKLWPSANRSYDLLYLPYNHKKHRTIGYAFVNFTSHAALQEFYARWQGVALQPEISMKPLDIGPTGLQGLEENIAYLLRSKRIRCIKRLKHFPVIIQPDGSFADFRALMEATPLCEEGVEEDDSYGDDDVNQQASRQVSVSAASQASSL